MIEGIGTGVSGLRLTVEGGSLKKTRRREEEEGQPVQEEANRKRVKKIALPAIQEAGSAAARPVPSANGIAPIPNERITIKGPTGGDSLNSCIIN